MRKRSSIESSSLITHNEEEREEAANTWNLDVKDRYMAHLQWKDLNILNLPTGDGLLHVQQRDKERITAHWQGTYLYMFNLAER